MWFLWIWCHGNLFGRAAGYTICFSLNSLNRKWKLIIQDTENCGIKTKLNYLKRPWNLIYSQSKKSVYTLMTDRSDSTMCLPFSDVCSCWWFFIHSTCTFQNIVGNLSRNLSNEIHILQIITTRSSLHRGPHMAIAM